MHVASCHNSSLGVVERLIEVDPVALLLAKSKEDELPLHKACRGGHLSIIHLLLEKHVSSASECNASGMLPFLLVCQSSGKSQRSIVDRLEFSRRIRKL
jgi:hypothetical protein